MFSAFRSPSTSLSKVLRSGFSALAIMSFNLVFSITKLTHLYLFWDRDKIYLVFTLCWWHYPYDFILMITLSAHRIYRLFVCHGRSCLLNYFLGISVSRSPTNMFLSQTKYAKRFLQCAHMSNCNQYQVSKISINGDPVSDPSIYHNIAGIIVLDIHSNKYFLRSSTYMPLHARSLRAPRPGSQRDTSLYLWHSWSRPIIMCLFHI